MLSCISFRCNSSNIKWIRTQLIYSNSFCLGSVKLPRNIRMCCLAQDHPQKGEAKMLLQVLPLMRNKTEIGFSSWFKVKILIPESLYNYKIHETTEKWSFKFFDFMNVFLLYTTSSLHFKQKTWYDTESVVLTTNTLCWTIHGGRLFLKPTSRSLGNFHRKLPLPVIGGF